MGCDQGATSPVILAQTHDIWFAHAGAGSGGGRRSAIKRRISANSNLGTATSAIWNATWRAWVTILARRHGPRRKCLRSLERVKGIEPSSSAWKAVALPLSYTRPATGGPVARRTGGRYADPALSGALAGPVAEGWWRGLDSNQRRRSQRIYSPSPLTTRAPLRACRSPALRREPVRRVVNAQPRRSGGATRRFLW
jgi:hypothetical protein